MRLLAFLSALLVALSQSATADTMRYFMNNASSRAVVVELSSSETGQRWPGDGKVFLLEKGERKMVPVECTAGERLCYGAWARGDDGVSWGIGPDGDRICTDCCVTCADRARPELVFE